MRRWRHLACRSTNLRLWAFCRRDKAGRRKALRALASEARTLALYEAPHRLSDTLEDALEILGNRPAVIAREVTKMYRGVFCAAICRNCWRRLRKKPARGEITLLIGPPDGQASDSRRFQTEGECGAFVASRGKDHASTRGSTAKLPSSKRRANEELRGERPTSRLLVTRDE